MEKKLHPPLPEQELLILQALSSTVPQARPLPKGQTQIAIAILNLSPSSWQAQRHQSFKM